MSWTSLQRARSFSKVPQGSKAGFQVPIPYTLNQLVKLELLTRNDGHQIKGIWDAYHQTKRGCAGKALFAEDWKRLSQRAMRSPLYVHALRRPAQEQPEEQFFALVSQFSHPHRFLFAQLDHFREFPHLAQPYLVLRVFDDLVESKGVALLRMDAGHTAVTTEDCGKILDGLVESYLDDARYESVKQFNDDPDNFDIDSALRSGDASSNQ